MKNLTLLLILVSQFAFASLEMTTLAKKEGWTFHFSDKPEHYATGLIKPKKGFLDGSEVLTYQSFEAKDVEIPAQYDLRGKIGEIRNQGNCGSCWSFSLTSMLRDAWKLAGQDPGTLSEQYLVDCARDMYGCNGGMPEAAQWLIDPKGPALLKDYPYTARNGRCQSLKAAASALEWHYVGASGRTPTVQEIQKAIILYGPVSVTVGADNAFSSYESGVYNACTNAQTNHMTNIVGWNDTEKYWIMRNSWGERWGEAGFMRIKYQGRSGRPCNRIGEQAVFVKINATPKPPIDVKDFTVEGSTITVKGTLKPGAKYKVEDAKAEIKDSVNKLDLLQELGN